MDPANLEEWSQSSVKSEIKIENDSIPEVEYNEDIECTVEIKNDVEKNDLSPENMEIEEIFDKNNQIDITKLQVLLSSETDGITNEKTSERNLNGYQKEQEPMMERNISFDSDWLYLEDFTTNNIHTSKIGSDRTSTSDVNSIDNRIPKNCQFCDRSFILKTSLDDHLIKQHTQEIESNADCITSKIHKCEYCSFVTTKKTVLTFHINALHNENRTKIKCQFCMKSYNKKGALDDHLLKKHTDEIKSDVEKYITSKIHKCNVCSYITIQISNLKYHINTHHNEHRIRLKCQFCHKSFTNKRILDNHVLKHHKNEIKNDIKAFITSNIHKCKICLYETTKKANLKTHINALHNEHKTKINCQFCEKLFTHKRTLDDHMLKQHKLEIKSDVKKFITNKIHSCNICSYQTTKKCHLDTHHCNP